MDTDRLNADETAWRVKRLEEFMAAFFDGNKAELGRALGYKDGSMVGQMLRGDRVVSEKTVKKLRELRKPKSLTWFDFAPATTGLGTEPVATGLSPPDEGYIAFDLLDVSAAAGMPTLPIEHPDVLRSVNVLESWARTTLGGDLSRIKLVTARGTSMQGTIENGDVLFVDSTVRTMDADGIYVIARGDGVQVKRLQRLHGGGLAIISDNRAYEPERLAGDEANSVTICGLVLAAWSLRRLW